MTDLFLGIIALAVLVMACIQVAGIILAARAARRVGDAVARLEHEVRPIVANLQTSAAELARATAAAAAQVDRAGRLVGEWSDRVDDAVLSVQRALLAPVRQTASILQGFKAALAAIAGAGKPGRTGAVVEDEDALFIG